MIITLVQFLLGIVAEKAICEPLRNPENNRLMMLIDRVSRLDKFLGFQEEINVSSIIRFVSVFFLLEQERKLLCMTSGFHHGVSEIFVLLGCYVALDW